MFANAWTRLSLSQSMSELPALPALLRDGPELVGSSAGNGSGGSGGYSSGGPLDGLGDAVPAYAPGSQVRRRGACSVVPLGLRLWTAPAPEPGRCSATHPLVRTRLHPLPRRPTPAAASPRLPVRRPRRRCRWRARCCAGTTSAARRSSPPSPTLSSWRRSSRSCASRWAAQQAAARTAAAQWHGSGAPRQRRRPSSRPPPHPLARTRADGGGAAGGGAAAAAARQPAAGPPQDAEPRGAHGPHRLRLGRRARRHEPLCPPPHG